MEEIRAFVERWHRIMPGVHSSEQLAKIYGLTKDARRPDMASKLILSVEPQNALATLQSQYPAIYQDDGVVERASAILAGVPGSLDASMADAANSVGRIA